MVLLNWVGHMAQFASNAGGKVDAGLPNITGDFGGASFRPYDLVTMGIAPSGAFFKSSTFQGNYTKLGSSATVWELNSFNASCSNSIYNNSQTVQPPAINVFAIMKFKSSDFYLKIFYAFKYNRIENI